MFIKWLEKCIYKVTNTKSRAYKTLSINEVRHHCGFFHFLLLFFFGRYSRAEQCKERWEWEKLWGAAKDVEMGASINMPGHTIFWFDYVHTFFLWVSRELIKILWNLACFQFLSLRAAFYYFFSQRLAIVMSQFPIIKVAFREKFAFSISMMNSIISSWVIKP